MTLPKRIEDFDIGYWLFLVFDRDRCPPLSLQLASVKKDAGNQNTMLAPYSPTCTFQHLHQARKPFFYNSTHTLVTTHSTLAIQTKLSSHLGTLDRSLSYVDKDLIETGGAFHFQLDQLSYPPHITTWTYFSQPSPFRRSYILQLSLSYGQANLNTSIRYQAKEEPDLY